MWVVDADELRDMEECMVVEEPIRHIVFGGIRGFGGHGFHQAFRCESQDKPNVLHHGVTCYDRDDSSGPIVQCQARVLTARSKTLLFRTGFIVVRLVLEAREDSMDCVVDGSKVDNRPQETKGSPGGQVLGYFR